MKFKLLILFLLLIYFIVFIFKENLKTKDVALCMIAKNENLYIKEFVEYYKNLGIKKIYLYDNNDINGENFNTILNSYINSKFIKIKNIRGKSEIQLHALNNCYQKYLNEYSWFLFLDVDEFLYIKNNKTLPNFLSDNRFVNCNTIFINYNEYGDSDLLKYDNRSIFKRFTQSKYIACGKSLTRGGIKNAKIDIHKPLYINNYCNSEGESEELYKDKIFISKIAVDSAEIKHFITKSLEEFCQRLTKGWPSIKIFSKSYYQFVEERIRYYFRINNITEYKYNIEIIFVDDFSSDNSVELIKNYQFEDERIILIEHNKNKGTLISRNDGALISKGEYLIFPDPDDILTQDILNTCYQYSKVNNYEIIRYNLFDQRENDIFYNSIVNKLDNRKIEQPELFYYLFYGVGKLKQIDFNLANKFIKREAYIRALNSINSFYLKQYMINFEDGIMNYILYKTSRSYYFLKNIGYFYIRNNQSITISQNINYNNRFKFIFLYLKLVFETTKNNKLEKKISILVFKWLLNLIKEGINSITKDINFFFDIINKYLKCKFIDNRSKIILKQLKFILYNLSKKNK